MKRRRTYGFIILLLLAVTTRTAGRVFAQSPQHSSNSLVTTLADADTVISPAQPSKTETLAPTPQTDSILARQSAAADSLLVLTADTMKQLKGRNAKRTAQWSPDPKRALWLSLVLPGAGQIYNRKYWKLPIIYGGFIGCTYALLWNGQMYHDYSQAYIDIMDDDPNTASYLKMLPLGYNITGREEQFKTIFKHKKDFYRRYRDLSIFAFIGVYLLSVVDAYVDAQLSSFDISKDLSLKVEPTVIQQTGGMQRSHAVGLQCSLKF